MQDRGDIGEGDVRVGGVAGLFDDPGAIAAIDARAAEDIAQHRLIGHQAVLIWLRSWGDSNAARAPWHD